MALDITEIKVFPVADNEQLCAFVRITVCDSFVIRDLKVIRNSDGHYFVAMPTRKDSKGVHHDVVHPINQDTRVQLEELVLSAYRAETGLS